MMWEILKTKKDLLKKIKLKKEFSGLADLVVESHLNNYLEKYGLEPNNFDVVASKVIVKEVRKELRNLTGRFQKSTKNRYKLLKSEEFEKLLKTHSSTAERINFYPKLKELLKELNIHSILDLGCGLNPIALASSEIRYFALDIKEDELSLIDSFFKKKGVQGYTFVYDLKKIKKNLPKADLCLLLKLLDVIDGKNHKNTENIIKIVPCKYILVSFSTKKLSGKTMNFPRRFWFEKLIKKLDLKYREFKSENEIFYLIEKN